MDSLQQILADVQALASAYLILTERSTREHSTERMGCRRIWRESQLPGYFDGPSDRVMLISMLRDVARQTGDPACGFCGGSGIWEEEDHQSPCKCRRAAFDAAEFERIFG